MRLAGTVNDRQYRVDVEDGQILKIWAETTERFGQRRAPISYWRLAWDPAWTSRRRGIGKRLALVIREAEEVLAKLEATRAPAAPEPPPPAPVSTPRAVSWIDPWSGRTVTEWL